MLIKGKRIPEECGSFCPNHAARAFMSQGDLCHRCPVTNCCGERPLLPPDEYDEDLLHSYLEWWYDDYGDFCFGDVRTERIVDVSEVAVEDGFVKSFTVTETGICGHGVPEGTGYVKMECRCLDGKAEGIGWVFDFTSNLPADKGHYLPISLSLQDTERLLEFMQEAVETMKLQESEDG